MRVSSFTEPGEVVFNLVAVLHLAAGVFFVAELMKTPELGGEWWFWGLLAGPVAFWSAVATILVRLRRSGFRPRFRFRKRLAITGSRECYRAYKARFGRSVFVWLIVAPLWSFLVFVLTAILR
ncbi:MAG: hypothetical protein ACRD00_00785 [Thermoanaerobaculia bacterium]